MGRVLPERSQAENPDSLSGDVHLPGPRRGLRDGLIGNTTRRRGPTSPSRRDLTHAQQSANPPQRRRPHLGNQRALWGGKRLSAPETFTRPGTRDGLAGMNPHPVEMRDCFGHEWQSGMLPGDRQRR